MRFGIHLPTFAEPSSLIDLALLSEERGWDACLLWDHVFGSRDPVLPMVDTWVTLGAIAERTERLRIGTAVTPLARRRPWTLARQATTVDHLSRGRLILGVGLGAPIELEYGAFGEDTDPRRVAERLDESLDVLSGLWSGRPFSYAGNHLRVDDVTFLPRPLQDRIPIWVGCTMPHTAPLERAARWDGVILVDDRGGGPRTPSTDQVATAVGRVGELRGGLDDFDVAVVVDGDVDDPAAFGRLGVEWLLVTGWLDDLHDVIAAGPPR